MSLQIYNTETRQKEEFKPLVPGKVGIYVCGITVYDFCHIGHARVMVAFDTIVRHLRESGLDVNYVRNITDIDDKIIARAIENKESVQDLTARFIDAMHQDERNLFVLEPDFEPRATEHIDGMQQIISTLIDKGHAYAASNGDVYFRVNSFESYGRLSGKNLDELQESVRIENSPHKEDPMDFVLWKAAKPEEPFWKSPWGEGRPGWHIECSAMAHKCIGTRLDIHGGGMDLQFPHHENEIAQSEACSGDKFVNTWMHVGFVRIDNEKMSKSLDNFFTIRDVLQSYHPETLRYFLLSSHYRSPLNYSDESLERAKTNMERLYTAYQTELLPQGGGALPENSQFEQDFIKAMDDDFNTPQALAVLFDLVREINKTEDTGLIALLGKLAGRLGLLQGTAEEFMHFSKADSLDEAEIEKLIAERKAARDAKDWAESDRIRDYLLEQGVELLDSPEGTSWRSI